MTATATRDTGAPPLTVDRFGHQPALDGLRGVAVAMIVAYHAQFPWATGGWLSMDVFFVLSGFLITSLAVGEVGRTGSINLWAFWQRRLQRLVPLLVVVIAAIIVWAAVGAPANELGAIRRDGLGSLFYVSNWVQIHAGVGYFTQFANPSPLTHTWSLAVEEQYYLVWPILIALAVRAGRRVDASANDSVRAHAAWRSTKARIGVLAAVGVAMSAATSLILSLTGSSPDRIYFGTDTRAQSLLIGSTLAVLRWGAWTGGQRGVARRRWLDSAAVLGVIAFGVATVTDVSTTALYRGGFLIVGLTAAVIIASAVMGGSPVARLLSTRPLRELGRISYGVYLWHWPVFVIVTQRRTGWSWGATTAARLAITLVLSVITFPLVEEMFRRRVKWRLALLPLAVAVSVVALLMATSRAVASDAERFAADQHRNAAPPTVVTTTAPPIPVPPPPTSVLVVGDSFGTALAAGWTGDSTVTITDATFSRCGPFRSPADVARMPSLAGDAAACGDWRTAWPAAIAVSHPKVVVVAARSWLALTQVTILRTENFQVDIAKPQLLASDEMSAFVDIAAAVGATVVFALPPADAFTHDEAGAVAQYAFVAPRLATIRPDDVAVLDLGTACGPSCTAATFGLDASPTGSIPGAAALPSLRTAIATDARARDLARSTAASHPGAPDTPAAPKVLLVGDSVGWSLGSYWYGSSTSPPADAPLVLWNRATYECELDAGPRVQTDGVVALSKKCANWPQDWASDVNRFDPDLAVTMLGSWEVFDRRLEGQRLTFASAKWDEAMSAILDRVITTLSGRGARVVLLTQPPTTSARVPGTPREWWSPSESRFGHVNDLIRAAAARHADVSTVIDLAAFVCPTTPCSSQLDAPGSAPLTPRPDGVHYDVAGAPVVARWLENQLTFLRRISGGTK